MVFVMNRKSFTVPLLSEQTISTLIMESFEGDIDIKIPRFKIESEHDLISIISANSEGEMPLICDKIGSRELEITDFIQKVVIDVNEKGTKAAALTCELMAESAWVHPVFKANRPFAFHIAKFVDNNVVFLFSGVYVE